MVQSVKRILSFEVPSATEWQSPTLAATFVPNWFEDISTTKNKKLNALKAYGSEIPPWPHPRSLKSIENLTKIRGSNVGFEYAEAFELGYEKII